MTSAAAFIAGVLTVLLGVPAIGAVALLYALLYRIPGRFR